MPATTHRQAVEQIVARYNEIVESGHFTPNKYPLHSLPFYLCIGFLLLPRSLSGQKVRLGVVFGVIISATYNIIYTRARDAAFAGAVGIMNTFMILWAIAHIGAVDPKKEYARIKLIEPSESVGDDKTPSSACYQWQGFPSSFSERLWWVIDLFVSLDGMGWQWGISTLVPPPLRVQLSLRINKELSHPEIKTEVVEKRWQRQAPPRSAISKSALLRRRWKQLALNYLALDLVKTLMTVDPFFYGQIDASAPSYIPLILQHSQFVKGVRLLISAHALKLAIQTVLLSVDLFCLSNHTTLTIGARGEAWMYPGTFGAFEAIFKDGLMGFWSTYWHQTFRYVFVAPTNVILKALNIPPKSQLARILRLCIAFFCSGLLHASVSVTAIGDTNPIRGPMLFFLLQPIGIFAQLATARATRTLKLDPYIPRIFRRLSNLCWVLAFGYLTAPLIIEDFARGGSFLFEPVPFSIFRGLGFGTSDDGVICWHGPWYKWDWDGWKSGIIS